MVRPGDRRFCHFCRPIRGLCFVNARGIDASGFSAKRRCPTRRGSASAGSRDSAAQANPQRHPARLASQAAANPPSPAHPPAHVMTANAPPAPTVAQALPTPAAAATIDGDATTGRQVYRKCQACHSLEPGKNALGPSLAGIIGKKAGEVPNYNYSPALKTSEVTWDAKTLDAYLADPQKLIPGNKMPFPGLKSQASVRDVIAYMAGGSAPAQTAQATPSAREPPPPRPAAAPANTGRPQLGELHPGRALHAALRHCRGPHGLSRRRRCDRRTGQPGAVRRRGAGGADHAAQRRGRRARYRLPGPGGSFAAHHRARRQHHHGVPRAARRRLHLFLQRGRPPARRHAGAVPGDAAAAGAEGGGSRHLAARHRGAAADRQSRAANGAGRPARGRTRRPARRGDDLRLLDLQRPRAGADAAGARRRHARRTCEEFRRQHA